MNAPLPKITSRALLLKPRDWQQIAQRQAADMLGTPEAAEKLAEARRYGALADELEHLQSCMRQMAALFGVPSASPAELVALVQRAIADRDDTLAAESIAQLAAEATHAQEPDGRLLDLLARIHGDGGHYVQRHGIGKAVDDADKMVAEWRALAAPQPAAAPAGKPTDDQFLDVVQFNGVTIKHDAIPQPAAAPRHPLTDAQIDDLMPPPDGTAEVNVIRLEVLPGVMGTEFEEADAWSRERVIQTARAIERAHGIGHEGGAA